MGQLQLVVKENCSRSSHGDCLSSVVSPNFETQIELLSRDLRWFPAYHITNDASRLSGRIGVSNTFSTCYIPSHLSIGLPLHNAHSKHGKHFISSSFCRGTSGRVSS